MEITEVLEQSEQGLVRRVVQAIKKHHLNQRTEQTYLHWICRFMLFHELKSPEKLENDDQVQFLGYLRNRVHASGVRLNQARNALEFFYRDVLDKHAIPALSSVKTPLRLDLPERAARHAS